MAASARLSPELRAALRLRIRHVHLPDLPPHYAPRALPGQIRDHLERQIQEQRAAAADPGSLVQAGDDGGAGAGSSDPAAAELRSWLQRAPPPPTVLSFTRRPTYVLPKHYIKSKEPWEVDYIRTMAKAKMVVSFPKPPGWSSKPYLPPWEADKDEKDLNHHPLRHSWEPGVIFMPCAEPMYFGPGQLSIWPVMDLRDTVQRGKTFQTKYEFERLLEDTTIQVLQLEYGITAFSIPGSPGVWVESSIPPQDISHETQDMAVDSRPLRRPNTRRIATIHSDVVGDITRHGVSVHVGSPSFSSGMSDPQNNPWVSLRQHDQTTSIAAELAYIGFAPRPLGQDEDPSTLSGKKSRSLYTLFSKEGLFPDVSVKAVPYSSVIMQPGLRKSVPLGLDNRDLSTAWTYEFARQLRLNEGRIDHFSITPFGRQGQPSSLPTKEEQIGFLSRRVAAVHLVPEPYYEVKVPVIDLVPDGEVTQEVVQNTRSIEFKNKRVDMSRIPHRAISWPLYHNKLAETLDASIRASALDNRYWDFMWQKEKDTRRQKRMDMLEIANTLEENWTNGPKAQLIRRPLTDPIVERVVENMLEMQRILATLQLGSSWKKKIGRNISQMQKVLQSRFVASKDGDANDVGAPANAAAYDWPSKLQSLTQLTQKSLEEAGEKLSYMRPAEENPEPSSHPDGFVESTRTKEEEGERLSYERSAEGEPHPSARPGEFFELTKTKRELQVERGKAKVAAQAQTFPTPGLDQEPPHALAPTASGGPGGFVEFTKTKRESKVERGRAKAFATGQTPPAFRLSKEPPRALTPTLRSRIEEREDQGRAALPQGLHRYKPREGDLLSYFKPQTERYATKDDMAGSDLARQVTIKRLDLNIVRSEEGMEGSVPNSWTRQSK